MNRSNASFKVPVLFLVFNRPDCTKKVFKAIAAQRPSRLYVAADGPRPDRLGEADLCDEVRAIATSIDWDCDLKVLFREENLGCKKAVSSAIDWMFHYEVEGIILEDDCLPAPEFFDFCEEMLERYQHNDNVMMISGDNFQPEIELKKTKYYFSKIPHIWGWATWKKAWLKYDADLKTLGNYIASGDWRSISNDIDICHHWVKCFHDAWTGKVNTWDYQWAYSIISRNALSVMPGVNLVQNIGAGLDATHTRSGDFPSLTPMKEGEFSRMVSPSNIHVDKICDDYTYRFHYNIKADSSRNCLIRWQKIFRRRRKVEKIIASFKMS